MKKKVCMIGAFAVGKTSLVARYVSGIFSEKYHTTVGVKIDKKQLNINDDEINLVIWDLAGQDDITHLRTSYLRGSSGLIIVADGTRPNSLETARIMLREAQEYAGDIPYVFAINKSDLSGDWQITDEQLEALRESGANVVQTSAKSGDGVDAMFLQLSGDMMKEVSCEQ